MLTAVSVAAVDRRNVRREKGLESDIPRGKPEFMSSVLARSPWCCKRSCSTSQRVNPGFAVEQMSYGFWSSSLLTYRSIGLGEYRPLRRQGNEFLKQRWWVAMC
jgi:hypothetical protein